MKPRLADHQFGIRHYAGEVLYDVTGVLEKNRDTFRDDILNMLKESRLDFIYDLFERVGSRNSEETLKMGTARRKPTVSSQFRVREEGRDLAEANGLAQSVKAALSCVCVCVCVLILCVFLSGLSPFSHGHSECVQPLLRALHQTQQREG